MSLRALVTRQQEDQNYFTLAFGNGNSAIGLGFHNDQKKSVIAELCELDLHGRRIHWRGLLLTPSVVREAVSLLNKYSH